MAVIDERYVRNLELDLAKTRESEREMVALITRIVTGDGQQRENLEMTNEEWEEELGNNGDVDITMDAQDWMAMVRVAKAGA